MALLLPNFPPTFQTLTLGSVNRDLHVTFEHEIFYNKSQIDFISPPLLTNPFAISWMPFTVTHIAAVLPFSYLSPRNLLFSALAIGSMIPDISVFMPGAPDYSLTHSLGGIFVCCVPWGIACFLLYQLLLKPAFFDVLPDWVRERLVEYRHPVVIPSAVFFLKVGLAVAIGAATHLVWDAFTHNYGWGVRVFPALTANLMTVYGFELTGYKIGQYGSTVVGLTLMGVLLIWWLRHREPQSADASRLSLGARCAVWTLLLLGPLSAGLIRAGLTHGVPSVPNDVRDFVFRTIQTSMFVFVVVSIAYGLVYTLCLRGETVYSRKQAPQRSR